MPENDAAERIAERFWDKQHPRKMVPMSNLVEDIRHEKDAEGVADRILALCRELHERSLWPSREEIADLIRKGRTDG